MKRFDQVTIVGLGLIGGSLGLALRRRGIARRVVGVARRPVALTQARRRGVVDQGFLAVAPAVAAADLVVLATPPSTVVPLSQAVAAATRHELLLTDVASTKAAIVRGWARTLPARIQAVGSHPMAGSERRGLPAASATLFDGALCLMTPGPRTSREARRRVQGLWEALGMRTRTVTAERHDAMVAMISHAPHLVAASLVAAATPAELAVAAVGFADTTRVALGDPSLWQDICVTNRPAVLTALARVERALVHLRQAIAYDDRPELLETLRAVQRKRWRIERCRVTGDG